MPNTYKATSLQDGFLYLDVEEGLEELPEYEGTNTPLLVDGDFERPRAARRRAIVLKGWLQGSTVSDYWTRLKAMHTLFDPKDPGTLSIPLGDATTATIEARVVAVVALGERFGRTREWRVILESNGDPFWTYT